MTNLTNDTESDLLVRRPLRRLFIVLAVAVLFGFFIFWRIDNERMAAVRADLVNELLPIFEFGIKPGKFAIRALSAIGDFSCVVGRGSALEEENRRLQQLRERVIVLEQQNAALREITNVQLNRDHSTVSGQVAADTSGAFRNSVLVNVGRQNGISDGWAVIDGRGLVGRISGVGRTSSRVLLLIDSSSRIPVKIQPSGSRGIVSGQNGPIPSLELVSNLQQVNPGDSIYTSGDGGIFPPNLLVGSVTVDRNGNVGVLTAANIGNLEFISVIRTKLPEAVEAGGDVLVAPSPGQPRLDD